MDGGVPACAREHISAGQTVEAPALITEAVATSWLAPVWSCGVGGVGNLLLARGE